MRKILSLSIAVAAIPFAAATVGPYFGQLRGSLGLEADWVVDGDFTGPATVSMADLGLLGSIVAGESGSLELRQAAYDDAYEQPGDGARAELAYGVSDNVEIFGAITWSHLRGGSTVLGDMVVASTGARVPLGVAFDDYNGYGGEVGARYFFDNGGSNVRAYVGASVGAQYVETLRGDITAAAAGVDLTGVGFYDGGTVFTAGAEAGVIFGDGATWAGTFSVGLKYTSGLDGSGDLESLGMGAIANGNEHISVPVRGTLSLSF